MSCIQAPAGGVQARCPVGDLAPLSRSCVRRKIVTFLCDGLGTVAGQRSTAHLGGEEEDGDVRCTLELFDEVMPIRGRGRRSVHTQELHAFAFEGALEDVEHAEALAEYERTVARPDEHHQQLQRRHLHLRHHPRDNPPPAPGKLKGGSQTDPSKPIRTWQT